MFVRPSGRPRNWNCRQDHCERLRLQTIVFRFVLLSQRPPAHFTRMSQSHTVPLPVARTLNQNTTTLDQTDVKMVVAVGLLQRNREIVTRTKLMSSKHHFYCMLVSCSVTLSDLLLFRTSVDSTIISISLSFLDHELLLLRDLPKFRVLLREEVVRRWGDDRSDDGS